MRDLYDLIFSLSPKSFTLVSTLIGFIFIDDLTPNEQNSLGNFFELIGQVMLTSAAHGQLLQAYNQNSQLQSITRDINKIKRNLNIE